MALIKTLSDLEDWAEYRKFVIAAFKSVKADSQFFVSKDDFDFEVKGKPWAGRVALFGDKGSATMAALKREGMQFRSGTCTEQNGDIQVTGISGALLKIVNKTFKKLPVSGKAVVAGDESDEHDEDAKASASGPDKKHVEATKKLKAAVYGDLKKVLADKPANRADLAAAYGDAEKLEKKGDHAGAQKALAELQKQIKGAAADASSADTLKGTLKDNVKAKKSGLRSDLTEALAKKPANQGAIVKFVRKSGEQEKAGQWQEALDSLTALEAEIAKAGGADSAADDNAANADAGVLQDTAAKQKVDLVKRAKKVLAEDPSQREPISLILKEAAKHEKNEDFDAQLGQYEKLEDLLESVSPTDDEDEDIELTSIDNWQQYRKWVRVRFKRLPKEAAAAEPFYISRKKMAFDLGGRQWRGHAVVAGKKARALAKELKRTGLLLLQGSCYAEGKVIHVIGLAGAALKAASKTLKLLKLGYTLEAGAGSAEADAVAPDDGGSKAASYAKRRADVEPKLRAVMSQRLGDTSGMQASEAYVQQEADAGNWGKAITGLTRLERLVSEAESGPAETDVIGTGLVKYRSELFKFAQAKSTALGQLSALESGVASVPDQDDLVDALRKELTSLFDDIATVVDKAQNASKDDAEPAPAAVRSEIDRAFNALGGSDLLSHVDASPWGVSIKEPLLKALAGIKNAIPA